MIRNIGLYQNFQISKGVAFKGAQETGAVTIPMENRKLNGTEALASYNSAFINKADDKFDIPLVKPVPLPRNIN